MIHSKRHRGIHQTTSPGRQQAVVLFSLIFLIVFYPLSAHAASACDLNSDGSTTVSDVQLCANQAIHITACATGNTEGT